jgi:pyrimidine operon attenuation protein/uracil phosphoribosyltransferase
MVSEKTLILDERQVQQKIKRMAFEIYEHNFNEKNIVVAGIETDAGYPYLRRRSLRTACL